MTESDQALRGEIPLSVARSPSPERRDDPGKPHRLEKERWERGWKAPRQCREPAGWRRGRCTRRSSPWPQGRTRERSQQSRFVVVLKPKPLYFQKRHHSNAMILPPPYPSLPHGVPAERVQELRTSGEEPTTAPGQRAAGSEQETRAPALPRLGGEQPPAPGNLNNCYKAFKKQATLGDRQLSLRQKRATDTRCFTRYPGRVHTERPHPRACQPAPRLPRVLEKQTILPPQRKENFL